MKTGTKAIIEYLNNRAPPFRRQHWADLLDDIAKLGREDFLRIAVARDENRGANRKLRISEPKDELLAQMARYRRKSGLSTREFIVAAHSSLSGRLEKQPSKAVMGSAPRYLKYLRQWLGADDIENIFAGVVAEYS